MEEVIGRRIVGHEDVGFAVLVEVGREDAQAPAVAVDDARLIGHVDEVAAVVAKDMVRRARESRAGRSSVYAPAASRSAELGLTASHFR